MRHRRRESFGAVAPVFVTMKVRRGLPSLRVAGAVRAIEECFEAVNRRALEEGVGFRMVHYSVQTDHVHAVVEAVDDGACRRGMHGLVVRIARALNRWWKRRGAVWADRFHSRVVRSRGEMRNVLRYVLCNARKHGVRYGRWDPFSSALELDGWQEVQVRGEPDRKPPGEPHERPLRVLPAVSRLLRTGWKQVGFLRVDGRPA